MKRSLGVLFGGLLSEEGKYLQMDDRYCTVCGRYSTTSLSLLTIIADYCLDYTTGGFVAGIGIAKIHPGE
jgi:hypothetical protein